MTPGTVTRRCGRCGKPIGATDVTCPHCDALLAAYVSPTGATTGFASAVNPVGTTCDVTAGHVPPTPHTASQHVDPRLQGHHNAIGLSAPTDNAPLHPFAPEQQALPVEPEQPVAALDGNRMTAAPPVGRGSRPFPTVVHPDRPTLCERPDVLRAPLGSEHRQEPPFRVRTADQADIQQSPTMERVRAQAHGGLDDTRRRPGRASAVPTVWSAIIVLLVVMLLVRFMSHGLLGGALAVVIVVVGLIYFMSIMAKASGRKTTSMPKDTRPKR